MKLSVARALRVSQITRVCVLLLTMAALLVTLVPAQTSKRGTTKRSTNKPRSSPTKTDMLTICQGVPVPSGYVIVAYMTTSACPHGAYVIRKQDSYSESVANTYGKSKATSPSAPATASKQPPRDSGDSRDSDTSFVADPFASAPPVTTTNNRRVTSAPRTATVDPVSTSVVASHGTGAGSRPRRVATSQ